MRNDTNEDMGCTLSVPGSVSQETLEAHPPSIAADSVDEREFYLPLELEEPYRSHFPLCKYTMDQADQYGNCRGEQWEQVLAHAHQDEGIICVRGSVSVLFDARGSGVLKPTSLFLHEYTHLIVPGGHTEAFWSTNRELHKSWGVRHARFSDALGTIGGSLLLFVIGLALWHFTGWGWFGLGSIATMLYAIPAVFNSFGQEKRETWEWECGNG